MIDLNDGIEHLAFHIIGQSYMVHYVDFLNGIHFIVTQGGFDQIITFVKVQCTIVYDLLVTKLKQMFPNQELMNALGIIYPQH